MRRPLPPWPPIRNPPLVSSGTTITALARRSRSTESTVTSWRISTTTSRARSTSVCIPCACADGAVMATHSAASHTDRRSITPPQASSDALRTIRAHQRFPDSGSRTLAVHAAQLALQELAGGVARQGLGEDDALGHLEGRQALTRVGGQLGLGRLHARAHHDDSRH